MAQETREVIAYPPDLTIKKERRGSLFLPANACGEYPRAFFYV
jgi:hypothetical protein